MHVPNSRQYEFCLSLARSATVENFDYLMDCAKPLTPRQRKRVIETACGNDKNIVNTKAWADWVRIEGHSLY